MIPRPRLEEHPCFLRMKIFFTPVEDICGRANNDQFLATCTITVCANMIRYKTLRVAMNSSNPAHSGKSFFTFAPENRQIYSPSHGKVTNGYSLPFIPGKNVMSLAAPVLGE